MSIEKSQNDKMDDNVVDNRVETYKGMMNVGYTVGLPICLAIVMFIALMLLGVGFFNPVAWIITLFTYLGVLGIAKTFFVH